MVRSLRHFKFTISLGGRISILSLASYQLTKFSKLPNPLKVSFSQSIRHCIVKLVLDLSFEEVGYEAFDKTRVFPEFPSQLLFLSFFLFREFGSGGSHLFLQFHVYCLHEIMV